MEHLPNQRIRNYSFIQYANLHQNQTMTLPTGVRCQDWKPSGKVESNAKNIGQLQKAMSSSFGKMKKRKGLI
ncbi:MAG: hypothetical protein D4R64_04090 [Porphyromonadaceae bacterium]|nr:MAG: hypothetical protein D4R64_04090 [Porphyromonadaceae bacterium]